MRCALARARPVVLDVLAVLVPGAAVLLAETDSWFSLLSALIASAALVLRRWWPRLAVLLCLPAMAGGLGWPPTVVALFRLGRARSGSPWLAGWVLLVTVVAVVPVLLRESLALPNLLLTLAFVLLAASGPIIIGTLIATRQQLTASLLRLREATEAESYAKAETARAEERAHIAREIHDAVGHHVTLIGVEAAALATVSEDAEVRDSANRLRGMAKEALGEMRTTLGLASGHRAAVSVQAIPDLVEQARATGIRAELSDEMESGLPLPSGVDRALYRVVQEALTNVSKHAPGSRVAVRLSRVDGMVRAEVRNDAPESPPQTGNVADMGSGAGLEGLSERVRMLGGRVEAAPTAEGGFTLLAALPLEPPG